MYKLGIATLALLTLNAPVSALPGHSNALSPRSSQAVLDAVVAPPVQDVNNICGTFPGGQIKKCNATAFGGGPCCSQYGWCGKTSDYCGKGCQPQYGTCEVQLSPEQPRLCGLKHKSKNCTDNECCSINGTCGTGEFFCGNYCQPLFGRCGAAQFNTSHPTTTGETQCGEGLPECPWRQCCSKAGYCGAGKEYCLVPDNCQPEFGWCDSKDTPQGLNHTSDPRDLFGNVSYGRIISRCTKPGVAALTFDDGPDQSTEAVLDLLREWRVKATFFLSGVSNGKGAIHKTPQWIRAVKRMIMEGHQIGSHGWSHRNMTNLTSAERKDEMYQNEIAIANIVGRYPTYMRAPYLACDNSTECLRDMEDLGYHVVSYNVDSRDWVPNIDLDSMKAAISGPMKLLGKNDSMIYVQHEFNAKSVALLNFTIDQMYRKGWKPVTIGQCLGDPPTQWYRAPVWNAPAYTSPDGCVVTDTDFCGQIQPFDDEKTCKASVDDCFKRLGFCWLVVGQQHSSCIEYDNICRAHKKHCDDCDDEECNIENWRFKRW